MAHSRSTLTGQYSGRIVKLLEGLLHVGGQPSTIFADFVDLTLASMEARIPMMEARMNGREYTDPPDVTKLFQDTRLRYGRGEPERTRRNMDLFAQAMAVLVEGSDRGWADILGETYMAWGGGGQVNGQFFTPYAIAEAMACMAGAADEAVALVHDRLKAAVSKAGPAGQAMIMAGMFLPEKLALPWYIARVLPHLMPHYEPVTVCDPAIGSGVMMLAYAEQMPWWMVKLGLVQFYGQDISHICVQMCKVNFQLYGLNGSIAPLVVYQMEMMLQKEMGEGAGRPPDPATIARPEPEPEPAPDPEPAVTVQENGQANGQAGHKEPASQNEPVHQNEPASQMAFDFLIEK